MKSLAHSLQSTAQGFRSASGDFRPFVCRPQSTAYSLQSAFTLIELIVVVAVIALLIGLLIPNLLTAREKAWSTNCQNNLRQFGIAINQYAADSGGYFNYAGGVGITYIEKEGGGWARVSPDGFVEVESYYDGGISGQGGISSGGGASSLGSVLGYVPGGVTLQSLTDGQASVRVCPAVLQQIRKEGNFLDNNSPNFKGQRTITGQDGAEYLQADFEGGWYWIITTGPMSEKASSTETNAYDDQDTVILSSSFSSYAVNHLQSGQSLANIPQNVVAFIDWNAKDGWGAYLGYTNWMFDSPAGGSIVQDTSKWTNAWWLTEVGFYHPLDNEYGANYVAMDGHVGWISSNSISPANF